jgi:hypothetical protein
MDNFAFYNTHIEFLYFLLTLKPNEDETAEKMKNVFYECVIESHFTSISGLGGSILEKKAKIVVPLFICKGLSSYVY